MTTVQQGHLYACPCESSGKYLALGVLPTTERGTPVRVAEVDAELPGGLGVPFHTYAERLQALPMRYFHGEVPL